MRAGSTTDARSRLRPSGRSVPVIWLTVLVTLFLFIYLFAALLRPEWF
jgi:K+-transporting ATPase KdpF subunit